MQCDLVCDARRQILGIVFENDFLLSGNLAQNAHGVHECRPQLLLLWRSNQQVHLERIASTLQVVT